MRINAETNHLVQKHLRQAIQPLEIFACTAASTATFAAVHYCCCSGLRYRDSATSMLGIVAFFLLCLMLIATATIKYRSHRPARSWISLALCMSAAFATAYILGDKFWWRSLVQYYTWRDMANYVNIDPEGDNGQSFMDAGTVYFKEGSYVLKDHTIAFRNGLTYCVAPIVRAADQNRTNPQAVNGFVMPRSGTVDFWAVGTDCCGKASGGFRCVDAESKVARSGLRVLDDVSRSMYLLGVQEWSAMTGLPVRHPLFFSWVKDPIMHAENLLAQSSDRLALFVTYCFLLSLGAAFFLHTLLQSINIH